MVLPLRDASDTSLRSVGDLLDEAFGDEDENTVDFRLVHAILLVLARALCVLERQVIIKLPVGPSLSYASSMVLSEVKVKTIGDKKKKGKKGKSEDSDKVSSFQPKRTDTAPDKSSPKKPRLEKISPVEDESTKDGYDKTSSKKRQQQEEISADRSIKKTRKASSDDLLNDKFDETSEKTSKRSTSKSYKDSNEEYTDTNRTISDKTGSTEKLDTYGSGKSRKTKEFDQDEEFDNYEEFYIGEEFDIKEEMGEEATQGEGFKKSFQSGKGGKSGKSGKSSKFRKTERTDSKSDESERHTGYPSSGSEKSSKKRASVSGEVSGRQDQTASSGTEKSSKKRASVSGEVSGRQDQTATPSKAQKRGKEKDITKGDFDIVESGESSESQQEKIIIVETIPAGAVPSATSGPPIPQSLVTIEQFEKLLADVIKLQDRFGAVNIPGMNAELLLALQRKASLSDPLAAIQLSGRLETVEKSLKEMLIILKDLASKTAHAKPTEPEEYFDTTDTSTKKGTKQSVSSERSKIKQVTKADQEDTKSTKDTKTRRSLVKDQPDDNVSVIASAYKKDSMISITEPDDGAESMITDAKSKDLITYSEMRDRLKEVQELVINSINAPMNRAQLTAENAIKLAQTLGIKLINSLNLGDKMNILEEKISAYAEKINSFDAHFSSTMTNYQEELQQMQHSLEIALENMAEALANRDTDTEAVVELNNRFTMLQCDIVRTESMQNELKYSERTLYMELRSLFEQIDLLKEMKSNRDEVEEALSTKASISVLNDKVAHPQYEAVIGDYQKRIASAYEKFNSQEMIWQKYIDDLSRDMNEKAEKFQVDFLTKNIHEIIDMLKERLDFMLNICGEPRINNMTRAMMRDQPCLSCALPADDRMDKLDETRQLQQRPQPVGAKADVDDEKNQEDGDGDRRRPCIPNTPILHVLDIRARKCSKYCGGVVIDDLDMNESEGIESSVTVRALRKEPKERVASTLKKPCVPCKLHKKKVSYTPNLNQIKKPESLHQALDENGEEIEIRTLNVGLVSEMMIVSDDPITLKSKAKIP